VESEKQTEWSWIEGIFNKNDDHIMITYGDIDDGVFEPIALVAPGPEKEFIVQFLLQPELENEEHQKMLDGARRELNFYLIELKEKDPWSYACYHCSTAANLYSKVHWEYYSKGYKGE